MKKLFGVLLSASVLTLSACGKQDATQEKSKVDANGLTKVTLASSGSDTDIWNFIAKLPETKKAGIDLKVQNFTDYVAMNNAVANKDIDANAFQSYAYMVAYNANNKDKVAPIATTYLEPMGIYATKYKRVEEFPQGATVAIPNDGANESRALLLLQSAGLVKLKANFDDVKGTPADIEVNSKKLVIKPIQMATAVRVKNDVDAIVLGNVLAMEGGLNVLKDSIYHEPIDQSTRMNVNIIAVADSRKEDPTLKKLGELYHTEAVKKYIQDHFEGTKVDVNKPVSYLTDTK
ncbi:MetQ/NlpA family ABC transporter substrate-binding protein [Acinetobacter gerneri]|jgi:D-methionine transport system substrate-binding protein|uniref:NLPA lipoprotein n=2 Tax=Acinetobacter gerneri TaxID=202952 RepID=N8ZGN5_9GAMM|nr:MetQ/NlpA family ABC transporter substrate-binding protein [Acinetobacter gerneri]ENV32909.1 hypothetical protein F960_03084 [Acinetobacter gerneri DSM 14967 = CIP 107464 = MTCC 9824]EPR85358.1 Methionine ABC transporter substrate-binding protein [Acinetobacter gerneri DSM 14967 = CIP 107464 = MTCC 9824]MCH4242901.1 MetQ/NlpA family ABC transporter substrate-binding protein [Acinetobacter gerneri]MDQ9008145.1 MetQ/NlpA family ABC transporter substrate-binding protein [Acinetobacter gerneri]